MATGAAVLAALLGGAGGALIDHSLTSTNSGSAVATAQTTSQRTTGSSAGTVTSS